LLFYIFPEVDLPEHLVDREDENRLTMPEVKVLVKDEPSLLEGYTTEEEAQMLADVAAKREHKHRGTRSNNVAANVDIKRTMARLVEEVRSFSFLKTDILTPIPLSVEWVGAAH
jgi:hypothetical protein